MKPNRRHAAFLAALTKGKVSITPIDADWTADPATYARLAGLR